MDEKKRNKPLEKVCENDCLTPLQRKVVEEYQRLYGVGKSKKRGIDLWNIPKLIDLAEKAVRKECEKELGQMNETMKAWENEVKEIERKLSEQKARIEKALPCIIFKPDAPRCSDYEKEYLIRPYCYNCKLRKEILEGDLK